MGTPAGISRLLLVLAMALTAAYGTTVGAEAGRRVPASTAGAEASSASRADATPIASIPTARPTKVLVPLPRPVLTRAAPVASRVVFARVRGVALVHPAERVERVGFHQASDIASVNMTPARTAVRAIVLPTRGRPNSRHTAADIVVHPQSEIRAPVSGIVKRAGNYQLYCKTPDSFAVISPDGHPELEVKLLHISGLRVRPGDRVVAGATLLAKRPTKLPFGSQVDAFTKSPRWPHVHIETTRLTEPSATPVAGPSTLAFGRC